MEAWVATEATTVEVEIVKQHTKMQLQGPTDPDAMGLFSSTLVILL